MTSADEEFLQALRATFKVEAAEHLQSIGSGLIALEQVQDVEERQRIVGVVFRAAHSLKGAARAVNLASIESLCQSLESLFAAWKRGDSAPTPEALDVAHEALNRMSGVLALPQQAASNPQSSVDSAPVQHVTVPPPAAMAPVHPVPGETETVRITVSALDERLLEAEEMLAAKLAVGQRASDLGALLGHFEHWRSEWVRIQPQARALRRSSEQGGAAVATEMDRLSDFFDWNQEYVRSLETRVAALRRTAEQDRLLVDKLIGDLLENSKKLLMLPLATLGALLPKVVRDLCRDQGKDAELVIRGDDVRIDKRILEQMKDPLIHLLRNSVDHGVETPARRRAAGKAPRATITLAVRPVGSQQVEISVSDDGAGIELDKVKAAASKRTGNDNEVRQLDDAAALALVFEPEVSTSPMLTEVSGRGLGLAIVREHAEKLGGRVSIESTRDRGTTIRVLLPLTLATFRGVVVEAAQRMFVLPTAQVERVSRFRKEDIRTVEGHETLAIGGRAVALAYLADVLDLPPARRTAEPSASTPLLLLSVGDQQIAFAVDAVHDEREILLKRLPRPLSRVRNVAGATVLGSGAVAPVLDVADLMKSARGSVARAPVTLEVAPAARRILVAEDSITSRLLLKGILESAGYDVTTAVDGMDAFTTLRSGKFDLVVSDVEMPRLNGFDLTARIRADRVLAETPVILVTALESREDRERGIDVGASAYLVKSNLDQSNLLEALRRLL